MRSRNRLSRHPKGRLREQKASGRLRTDSRRLVKNLDRITMEKETTRWQLRPIRHPKGRMARRHNPISRQAGRLSPSNVRARRLLREVAARRANARLVADLPVGLQAAPRTLPVLDCSAWLGNG